MLEMATAFNPHFAVKRLELEREGISYTIDTLKQIHQANPEYALYLLMDTDWLSAFATWYRPREIADLATLMTINRGNRTTVDLEPLREILTPEAMDRIIYVQMPEMSLSASDIRRRIRQKLSIRYLTPPSVVEYIMQHRLYTDEYPYL
jgi:nicotinate-nucleotide adenylyltransferase